VAAEKEGLRELAAIDPVAERIVRVLDGLFRIPGTNVRFGLDPLIGLLLPGVGDAATGLFGAYVLVAALRHGVPLAVVLQMAWNLALDAMLGAIPFVGDVFDFAWKANDRNLALLRKHAGGRPAGAGAWIVTALVIAAIAAAMLLPLAVVAWGIWR
jgi:uncharacterized protein DUF4112